MSRTDKDRPYRVRRLDPLEKRRYWKAAYGSAQSRWYSPACWELDIRPYNLPGRWAERKEWSSLRNQEQVWSVKARYDHELEAPDGRARHSMYWWWA